MSQVDTQNLIQYPWLQKDDFAYMCGKYNLYVCNSLIRKHSIQQSYVMLTRI